MLPRALQVELVLLAFPVWTCWNRFPEVSPFLAAASSHLVQRRGIDLMTGLKESGKKSPRRILLLPCYNFVIVALLFRLRSIRHSNKGQPNQPGLCNRLNSSNLLRHRFAHL